jgi:hypothetical protein
LGAATQFPADAYFLHMTHSDRMPMQAGEG